MIRLKPTKNRVLIEPIQDKEDRVGTIVVPEANRDKPTEGMVLRIGPLVENVKIGDRVIYNRFEGEDIQIGNKIHKLFRDNELLGVIE